MVTVIASIFGAKCITALWGMLLDLEGFAAQCCIFILGILSSLLIIALIVAVAVS